MKTKLSIILSLVLVSTLFGTSTIKGNTNESFQDGVVSIDDVVVSDPMTFDELVEQYAEDAQITVQEARESFNAFNKNDNVVAKDAAATYRTLYVTLKVDVLYEPKISFYCETSEGGNYGVIKRVMYVSLIRTYTPSIVPDLHITRQFDGTIFYHLQDGTHIYYTIDGDFYSSGHTSRTSPGAISVGGSARITFTCSDKSRHVDGYYHEATLKWGNG